MPGKIIGVISDTHGLLRDEVRILFKDCDLILHAGDVGNPSLLVSLKSITEVRAVRGNVDTGKWAESLQETEYLDISGKKVLVIHQISRIAHIALPERIDIIIYGHSHTPDIKNTGGILYLNPGSAGPRRFDLPVSLGVMRIENGDVYPEIIKIKD